MTKEREKAMKNVMCDLPEAATILGVTDKALRARVARQAVPYRKLGGRVMFVMSELELFIEALPGVSLELALEKNIERIET